MSKSTGIVFAGFGGQGLQHGGKVTAYAGLNDNKEVSLMPSYGPEVRGGTSTCSVIVSDITIGSPLVPNPDILVAMNLPSLDKFESTVVPGGTILVDSSMIARKVERTDVNVYYVDATKIADEQGMKSCAIIIMLGKMMKECGTCSSEAVNKAIEKILSGKKEAMIAPNKKAFEIGFNM